MISSRKDSFNIQALQFIDAFLVWLAFWLAGYLRELILWLVSVPDTAVNTLSSMLWVLYITVPFTPLVLDRFGFYEHLGTKKSSQTVWQLVRGILLLGLFIALFILFMRVEGTRRLVLLCGAGMMFVNLFVRDRITTMILYARRKNGLGVERVVLTGLDSEIEELLEDFSSDAVAGWEIVDRFDLNQRSVEELYALLKKESVARVVFATKNTPFEKVADAVEVCELQGVEAWVAASFIRGQIARPVFDSIGSKPMLVLRSTPELSWSLMIKDWMDRVGAFCVICATLPLWFIAAVGIRITSPGAPVLFSQMRAGRYGMPFRMWKFRTMVANAEELLEKIKQEHGNQMDGPVFKLDHDPRIFPFGALLRKLSIDELPQLWNVLCGDMSLVGPRPLPLYEVEAFSEMSHRRRLSVKPGITCEWQAGGRNKITKFEDWVKMDLRYIDNWSLWLDIMILLKTIPAVIFGKGAK